MKSLHGFFLLFYYSSIYHTKKKKKRLVKSVGLLQPPWLPPWGWDGKGHINTPQPASAPSQCGLTEWCRLLWLLEEEHILTAIHQLQAQQHSCKQDILQHVENVLHVPRLCGCLGLHWGSPVPLAAETRIGQFHTPFLSSPLSSFQSYWGAPAPSSQWHRFARQSLIEIPSNSISCSFHIHPELLPFKTH